MKNGLNYVCVNVSPSYETVIDPVPAPPPPPRLREVEHYLYIYVYIPLYWDTKILKQGRCIWESSKSSTGFYSLNLSDHSIVPPSPSTHPSGTNEAGNARYLMPFHTNIGLDLTLICCYWCCYYVCTQYIIPPRRSHQLMKQI